MSSGWARSTLLSSFNIWKRPVFPAGTTQSLSCPLLRFNQILERVADLFPEKEIEQMENLSYANMVGAGSKYDRQIFFGRFFPTFKAPHCIAKTTRSVQLTSPVRRHHRLADKQTITHARSHTYERNGGGWIGARISWKPLKKDVGQADVVPSSKVE